MTTMITSIISRLERDLIQDRSLLKSIRLTIKPHICPGQDLENPNEPHDLGQTPPHGVIKNPNLLHVQIQDRQGVIRLPGDEAGPDQIHLIKGATKVAQEDPGPDQHHDPLIKQTNGLSGGEVALQPTIGAATIVKIQKNPTFLVFLE